MLNKTLFEIFAEDRTRQLITPSIFNPIPEWLAVYNTNKDRIDKFYLEKYGKKILDDIFDLENNVLIYNAIQQRVDTYLLLNKEKYDRLWIDYTVEYNPIENYNRNEELTDTYGKRFNKDTIGSITNTVTNDKVTSVSQNDAVPFNGGSDFSEVGKTTTTSTGTGVGGKVVNESNVNQHINESEEYGSNQDGSRTDKHINHTHGNIGVTTTIDMLAADVNFWMSSEFYDILFKDIINECTISIWG